VFSGAPEDVEAMVALCREGPRYAEVEGVEVSRDEAAEGLSSFEIWPTQ
jgi:acylphosphatase